jgi:hypothetical protein
MKQQTIQIRYFDSEPQEVFTINFDEAVIDEKTLTGSVEAEIRALKVSKVKSIINKSIRFIAAYLQHVGKVLRSIAIELGKDAKYDLVGH